MPPGWNFIYGVTLYTRPVAKSREKDELWQQQQVNKAHSPWTAIHASSSVQCWLNSSSVITLSSLSTFGIALVLRAQCMVLYPGPSFTRLPLFTSGGGSDWDRCGCGADSKPVVAGSFSAELDCASRDGTTGLVSCPRRWLYERMGVLGQDEGAEPDMAKVGDEGEG